MKLTPKGVSNKPQTLSIDAENDNLIYTNSSFKGYALLSLNKESARVVYKYVSTVKSTNYKNIESPTFDIKHNQPIKIGA